MFVITGESFESLRDSTPVGCQFSLFLNEGRLISLLCKCWAHLIGLLIQHSELWQTAYSVPTTNRTHNPQPSHGIVGIRVCFPVDCGTHSCPLGWHWDSRPPTSGWSFEAFQTPSVNRSGSICSGCFSLMCYSVYNNNNYYYCCCYCLLLLLCLLFYNYHTFNYPFYTFWL